MISYSCRGRSVSHESVCIYVLIVFTLGKLYWCHGLKIEWIDRALTSLVTSESEHTRDQCQSAAVTPAVNISGGNRKQSPVKEVVRPWACDEKRGRLRRKEGDGNESTRDMEERKT